MSDRKQRTILVVNDDGIDAEGIRRLTAMAKELGEVWVAAPAKQCSAMSQRITVRGDIIVKKVAFPVAGVQAYSVDGTPADCVKVAMMHLLLEKPDVVFSGINCGYNVGYDIAYSGTVGAAMEALMQGIPAIAFSNEANGIYEVADHYLLPVAKELLEREISREEIWNVNFPGCPLADCQGIRETDVISQSQFYLDHYDREDCDDGSFRLSARGIPVTETMEKDSDMRALLDHYICIGKIRSNVVAERRKP